MKITVGNLEIEGYYFNLITTFFFYKKMTVTILFNDERMSVLPLRLGTG